MKTTCVGFDLDGVLYDWYTAIYTYFRSNKNFDGSYDSFWTDWKKHLLEDDVEYLASVPIFYEACAPTKQALSVLKELSEFCEIYYITARPAGTELVTERYLRKNNFPDWFNLTFSCDKGMHIRQFGVSYYLDDNPKIIKDVKNLTNAYLLDTVYYRDLQEGLPVVYSLQEFSDIVKGDKSV